METGHNCFYAKKVSKTETKGGFMREFITYNELVRRLTNNVYKIKDLPCMADVIIRAEYFGELQTDLKRSISKRPLRRYWEGISHYYECPECNVELDSVEENPYCPYCGQAINWSDENDE